jgi:hypothetical protein
VSYALGEGVILQLYTPLHVSKPQTCFSDEVGSPHRGTSAKHELELCRYSRDNSTHTSAYQLGLRYRTYHKG